ncbi:hypothetical protein JZU54_05785, partial [bacterium]|nr:hypothetical protein [bacterium]
ASPHRNRNAAAEAAEAEAMADWQDWARNWTAGLRIPVAPGFATDLLSIGQPIIDRGAAAIAADWQAQHRERAIAQFAGLFEVFTPASTAWLREHTLSLGQK